MSNIIPLKQCLRQEASQLIQKLEGHAISESDIKIRNHILKLSEYQEAKVIFCFVNADTEIDTKSLIKETFEQNKRLCVPRCIGKGSMQAFEIESLDDLHSSKYGIMEPMSST